ncbi:MAG: filamentous hemagglutinin N-terminal domain-containing protein, partial [Gallionella sp.]|nr:filamentous hemagglutinin N-terminal domain-containing protein [Gallionella sp.]
MNQAQQSKTKKLLQSFTVKLSGGKSMTYTYRPRPVIHTLLATLLAGFYGNAWALDNNALPTNGNIVAGGGAIAQTGANMSVTQATQNMVVTWGSFNIGADAHVNYAQPNSSAVALNRVTGSDISQIFGQLTANGKVFLINSSGVLFGTNAKVDVGGLVASTLDISNENFMSGNYTFSNGGNAGSVVNLGTLTAAQGGYIALLAPEVRNEGIIVAKLGTVALAAGNKITLDIAGDSLIKVAVNEGAVNALASNKGLIKADGGSVYLSAKGAGDLAATVVNNEGIIEAQGLIEHDGKILLVAEQGSASMSGTLNASAADATANGGEVRVLAMDANATFTGNIEARGGSVGGNGGFAEVSGKTVKIAGAVDMRAPHGKMGDFLIDPANLFIIDGVNAAYAPATDVSITNGTITNLTTAANLTLQATDNITSSATNITGGGGNLTLQLIGGGTPNAINTASTPIVMGAGTLTVISTGAGAITLGSVTGAGVTITGSAGQVDVRSIDTSATGGAVGISSTGGAINMLNNVNAGLGAVTVTGGAAVGLSAAQTITAGLVSLTAGGGSNLNLSGNVVASDNVTLASTGTININSASTASGKTINLNNFSNIAITGSVSAGVAGIINVLPTAGTTIGVGGGVGAAQVTGVNLGAMTALTVNVGTGGATTNNTDIGTLTPANLATIGTLNIRAGTAGTITQSGGSGIDINTSATNVNLIAGGGVGTLANPALFNVDLTGAGTGIFSANTSAAAGDIYLQTAAVGTTNTSRLAFTTNAGSVQTVRITDTAGILAVNSAITNNDNLTLATTAANKNINVSANVTANSLAANVGAGGVFNQTANGISTASAVNGVTITADNIALAGTTAAGAGAVTLKPTTAGQLIQVGAGATDDATHLGLSNTELDTITTTGILTVGVGTNTGGIAVVGATTAANADNLTLTTGGAISETAGTITRAAGKTLALNAATGIGSGGAMLTSSPVITFNNSTSGNVLITDSSAAVTTFSGSNAGANIVTLLKNAGTTLDIGLGGISASAAGTVNIDNTAGAITDTTGGTVTGATVNLGVVGATAIGTGTLNLAVVKTAATNLDARSSAGAIYLSNTGVLSNTNAVAIAGPVNLQNTVALTTGTGSITSSNNSVVVSAGGLVTNTVGRAIGMAGGTTTSVTGTSVSNAGMIRGDGGVTVVATTATTGTITNTGSITNGVLATAVNLTADDMVLAAGTITGGTGAVTLTTTSATQGIVLGAGGSDLGLSAAELNSITNTTGGLTIGDIAHTGTITADGAVTGIVNPSGAWSLLTNGGVVNFGVNAVTTPANLTINTKGAGAAAAGAVSGSGALTIGALGANALSVTADGGIDLQNVGNLANAVSLSDSGTGNIAFKNNRNMTLTATNTTAGGTISVVNATGTLDTAAGGVVSTGAGAANITLQTAGLLTVAVGNSVTAGGTGSVSLTGLGVTNNATVTGPGAGPGGITIDAGTGAFTQGAAAVLTKGAGAAANISITADDWALTGAGSSITAGTGDVTIATKTAGGTINLNNAGTNDLTTVELATITANNLYIGAANSTGLIDVKGIVTFAASTPSVTLRATNAAHNGAGSITNSGNALITTNTVNLNMIADSGIGSAGGAGAMQVAPTTGSISATNYWLNHLNIAVTGDFTVGGGNIVQNASLANNTIADGNLGLSATGNIIIDGNVDLANGGTITINAGDNTKTITEGITGGTLRTGAALDGLTGSIVLGSTATKSIGTGPALKPILTKTANLTANSADGDVYVSNTGALTIAGVSAAASGAGTANFSVTASSNLIAAANVTAKNNVSLISTGTDTTLTLNAGTTVTTTAAGSINLTADKMVITAGAAIGTAALADAVNLNTYNADQGINLGAADSNTELGLTDAELNLITTTGLLTIGGTARTALIQTTTGTISPLSATGGLALVNSGDITLTTGLTSTTGALTLTANGTGTGAGIISGAGVLTGAAGLSATAGGGINLSGDNVVTGTVALVNTQTGAPVASGNIAYTSNTGATGVSITGNSDNTAANTFTVVEKGAAGITVGAAGINTSAGNGVVTLQANALAIANAINAGSANVYLLPFTAGNAASIAGLQAFDLSAAELNAITTSGTIVVGENVTPTVTAGAIDFGTSAAANIGAHNLKLSGTSITAGAANNTLTTSGNITLVATNTVDGNVGAGTDLAANTLIISSVNGIGATNPLSTAVSNLNYNNTTGGAVSITNAMITGVAVSGANVGAGSTTLSETAGLMTVGIVNSVSGISGGAGAVTLNAKDGITVNENVSTDSNSITINADSNTDQTGTLTVATGKAVTTTTAGAIGITAANLALNGTGALTSAGTVGITVTNSGAGGTLGLGAATGQQMVVDNSVLSRITAAAVGGTTFTTTGATGDMTVDGVTLAGTANTGKITLSGGNNITFSGAASNFTGALAATAAAAVAVNANVFTASSKNLDLTAGTTMDFGSGVTVSAGDATPGGTGVLTLTSTGAMSSAAGTLTLKSQAGMTLTGNLTTAGATTINADQDNNGAGTFSDGGFTVNTTGNALNVTAADVVLTAAATSLNSGAGKTTITATNNRGIDVGNNQNAGAVMSISDAELGLITALAGGLDIKTTGAGTIRVDGVTAANTVNTGTTSFLATGAAAGGNVAFATTNSLITGNVVATATSGKVTFDAARTLTSTTGGITLSGGDGSASAISGAGATTLTAANGVAINSAMTNALLLTVNADNDANGTGAFSNTGAITVTGAGATITAKDVTIGAAINATGQTVTINTTKDAGNTDAGQLGLGATSSDMTISGAELQNITATTLTLNAAAAITIDPWVGNPAGIIVDGITDANSANIGTINLNGTAAQVVFVNTASVFRGNLAATAAGNLTVWTNLSTTNGTLSLTSSGVNVVFEDGVTVTAGGANALSLSAPAGYLFGYGSLTLNSGNGLNLADNLSTFGVLNINADYNSTGGALTVANGKYIRTTNWDGLSLVGAALNITASDVVLTGTGALDSGTTSKTTITSSVAGNINLGSAVGALALDSTELSQITSGGGLDLKTTGAGNINANAATFVAGNGNVALLAQNTGSI